MPSQYFPNGTIPSVGPSSSSNVAILASNGTTPIAVETTLNGTTPGPHGMSTGDNVEIVGHLVNLAANGLFQITVTGPNAFTLNGSVGSSNGGRTGNVRTFTVDPSFTLPSGGDQVTAASVNAFAEGCANAIPFAYLNSGKFRVVDQYYTDNHGTGTPWVAWGSNPTTITALNVPQACTLGIFAGAFGGYVNPPGLAFGDILDIDLISDFNVTTGSSYAAPAYSIQAGIGIVAGTPDSNPTLIAGSLQSLGSSWPTGSVNYVGKTHLRNTWTPPNPYTFSQFDIWVMANAYNVGSGAPPGTILVQPSGIFSLIITHYRLNGAGI